jgi:hypothetical protein
MVTAIAAITGFRASQSCVIAFAVLLLAVSLLAVAALVGVSVIIERPALELLFGL